MMHRYITLEDETHIAYSGICEDGTIKIVCERPRDWGMDSATCYLPACRWFDVDGFSAEDLDNLTVLVQGNSAFVFELVERDAMALA